MTETLPVKYIKFITKRCFGIELEVNKKVSLEVITRAVQKADQKKEVMASTTYQQDNGNNYWHCKFDRSCGNKAQEGGWEVASYKASGVADLLKIANMGTVLKDAGAEVNDNCGYHIHVEIKDFEPQQAATLVAYWMKIEPLIMEILPKNRRNNIYCQLLREVKPVTDQHLKSVDLFWNRVRPVSYDNNERRVSLNMCHYALGTHNKRTVELRLPEGTLDETDIKNWARMFIHFVGYCKRADFPGNVTPVTTLRDLLTVLGLHNDEPFFILSKGLYETKNWVLQRALKYSSKKNIRKEAQDFLDYVTPPVINHQAMVRNELWFEPHLPPESKDKEKDAKKPKKKKESLFMPMQESEYWEPYEDENV